ncbi:hypothetical protein BTA51_00395 [Hahella sp. CCB-MM4]|uniref:UbiH/UbiF/VisC/COQ6 family ubiquinone biosynthesis hydroxylase n=1 Tax=Hahella sp. (strain CCB-MM4) TaxID=1926491 RepID=UPI000B9B3F3D|nr:UbiH/UbiF/VisC/COQ6 family ubiquinone biosynthesis hydroxylase [Hahella sp. CCB-MM4]OZG75475.1 hypothetical protein BTA51_00395 [Hahella sp. CCB-MM4]
MSAADVLSETRVFDIVVVGGGLVGAATAIGAARLGYRVAVLDPTGCQAKKSGPLGSDVKSFDLRVSALTRASQRLLDSLGCWEPVVPFIQHYVQMDVWDAEGSGRIHFSASEVFEDDLGCIVENSRVLSSLYSELVHTDNIEVIPASLESLQVNGSVSIVAEGHHITASLLIGADGALSRTRQLLSLPTREWDYGQEAIVATIQTEQSHESVARQRFLQSGPLALLPLHDREGSDKYCSIVWSVDQERCRELYDLDDDSFKEQLAQASEWVLGKVVNIGPRAKFPLIQRHAKHYIASNSLLVGDAAHTIHPLAGQGVNLGFQDVRVLLEELERAKSRRLKPGETEVLKRYQRRRQPENLAMMAAMESFKRGFTSTNPVVSWLRNEGMNRVNALLPVKKAIIRQAMGL